MILGLIEHDRGTLNPQSLEMLTLARELAAAGDGPLHVLLVGGEAEGLAADLAPYGPAVVHLARHEALVDYAPAAWAQALVDLIAAEKPAAVLAPGSDRGSEVMAHAAARLNLPMAANCTAVTPGEAYRLTRVRWGGSLLEEAWLRGDPKLLTVAPFALPDDPAPEPGAAVVRPFTPALSEADLLVRVVDRVQPAGDKVSLTEAKVVVSGGRGVGSAEGFDVLGELADLLGGAVGGSRVATNFGWCTHANQIGQTGTRIAPDLYIACGISGAIQHWVGCKGAKQILAVNTDPEAPMVTRATYAVIGDLHEILPALIAEIRRVRPGG